MLKNLAQYNKMIVAFVVPILTGLLFKVLASKGFPLTPDFENSAVVILTGLLVWLIPNVEK